MGLYEACRAFILCVATFFSIPLGQHDDSQQPIFSFDGGSAPEDYPRFPAPHGPDSSKDFICKYKELGDEWESCSTPENRQCWLRSSTGKTYDINTDYELNYPPGVLREVSSP